jgi:FkbM family methyltransferase
MKTYSAWFGSITLDTQIDFYGDSFWSKIQDKTYEPDTMVFLENHCGPNSDFVDIEAATGAMSLIAASLGARVLAFEPIPSVYKIAKKHLESNPEISNRVSLQNKAISDRHGFLRLDNSRNKNIVSDICYSSLSAEIESPTIEIASLKEEIDVFHQDDRSLIVKVDMEGAEWKLFSDEETLLVLRSHSAKVLLAIHPGFNRPLMMRWYSVKKLSKKIWQLRNLILAYTFFGRLMRYAEVKRTNLDPVKNPIKAVFLMFGNYFEFILDFSNKAKKHESSIT